MTFPAEKPLEGWRQIAKHLGKSERTVQRWQQKGLPVYRHEALGVIAYRSELDLWIANVKKEEPAAAKKLPPNNTASIPALQEHPLKEVHSGVFFAAGAVIFVMLVLALRASAYGLAILAFCLGAPVVVLGYRRGPDTPATRAFVALYMIAAMAYICSASTMPEFQATVINAATLSPSGPFLVVIGLKFVPLFVLVLLYWVIFGCQGDAGFLANPAWERRYMRLGILFLGIEFIFLAVSSGDDRVWKAGVPGRWTLLIGSAVVLAANLAVWLAGRHYFRSESISSYRPLFCFCVTAYLLIAVAAFFIDHQHNRFNRYYLNVRWPEAYVSRNPDAIADVDALLGPKLRTEIGPDLANLLKDPEFRRGFDGTPSTDNTRMRLSWSFIEPLCSPTSARTPSVPLPRRLWPFAFRKSWPMR